MKLDSDHTCAAASTSHHGVVGTVSKKQRRRENRRKTIALLGGASRKGPLTPPPYRPLNGGGGGHPRYYDTMHTSSPAYGNAARADWQRASRAGSVEIGEMASHRGAGQVRTI